MRFAQPEYFYWLVGLAPLLAFLIYFLLVRFKSLKGFGSSPLMQKLSSSLSRTKVVWKMILIFLAITFALIALTAPQIGTKLREVKRKGIEIVIALDVSNSMLAEDVKPSRLSKAKFELSRLVEKLGEDRVGIVLFAGDAFLQSPLTLDKGATKLFIDLADPNSIGAQGTNFTGAVDEAIRAFRDNGMNASSEKNTTRNKVIILVSDGEDHEGDTDALVKRTKDLGMKVFTVGVGSNSPTPIPVLDEGGKRVDFKRDKSNSVITTQFIDTELQLLADKGGGKFFRIDERSAETDRLLAEIQKLDKEELASKEMLDYDHKFQIFLGLALFCLLLESLLSDRRRLTT
jgi:Ca-activated chloride channel homolog